MEDYLLLERMGIVSSLKERQKVGQNLEFYNKYAFTIFKSLRKPIFQRFLTWILRTENIPKGKVKDIQIRMFPLMKLNGNYLNGKCNSKGEVFLYPKKFDACKKRRKKISQTCFIDYIKGRARASLIHEILHLKYEGDEKKVKELTKKYYLKFYSNIDFNPLDFKKHKDMVFNY